MDFYRGINKNAVLLVERTLVRYLSAGIAD